jgi:hypothetical protein
MQQPFQQGPPMHHASPYQHMMHMQRRTTSMPPHPTGQQFHHPHLAGQQFQNQRYHQAPKTSTSKGIGGIFSNLLSKSQGATPPKPPGSGSSIGDVFSNLFSKSKNTDTRAEGIPSSASASEGNVFTKMLSGVSVGGIANTLGNMQRITQTASTVIPTFQQYGPMVKNLPSLLKIFKEVNSDDGTTPSKTTTPPPSPSVAEVETSAQTSAPPPKKEEEQGQSNPKMYI